MGLLAEELGLVGSLESRAFGFFCVLLCTSMNFRTLVEMSGTIKILY